MHYSQPCSNPQKSPYNVYILGSVGEWLQVDLKTPIKVTGVVTQGRANADQWITTFNVAYGNSSSCLPIIQDENGNDMVGYLVY